MAKVSIREYEHISAGPNGIAPMGQEPALASQSVVIGGASVQSAVLNARTRFIRLQVEFAGGVSASMEFGTDPTATSTTFPMAAGSSEYVGVPQGLSYKVAVITA